MSQAEFDRCMPHEFWREVVDRVAVEVPGTLLLAEAFWLMEGYFVRTLGMHRVYNSAFMVMLRDEDNAKYRSVIKNTLEFDPDIMKRYVNFMSNPDERTAIDQFGKGDKCFGVATMMATLPGLPMFGHGQIEGFTEKYGMEYQRPRYNEDPDPWMVERHEREIAPLLHRRRIFAESGNFLLYDFFTDSGHVDENVFAYSNRYGDERALVVYHNHYGGTHGTIDYSAAYADKGANQLRQRRLGEGLGLTGNPAAVLAWRDSITNLHFLRRANELSERGLTVDLHAYQCHVFLDWRELYSTAEHPWDRLCDHLQGRGVPDLQDALDKLELQPVHDALRAQLDPGLVRHFADLAEHPRTLAVGVDPTIESERTELFAEIWARCENLMRQAQRLYLARAGSQAAALKPANPALLGQAFRERLRAAMRIPAVEALFPAPWTPAARRVLPSPSPQLTATAMWGPVLGWCALELLAESIDRENPGPVALDLFDRLRLREPFAQAFNALGFEGEEGWRVAARIKVVLLTDAGVGKPAEPVPVSESDVKTSATGLEEPKSFETSEEPRLVVEHGLSYVAVPAELTEASVAAEGPGLVSGHGFSRVEDVAKSSEILTPAEESTPPLWPALWSDPDVRWLTGVHPANGHDYLVRELYEELLWWLLMPSLLRLAAEPVPSRSAVETMSKSIDEALAAARSAGYRLDEMLAPPSAPLAVQEPPTDPAPEPTVESEPEPEPEPEASAESEIEPDADSKVELPSKPESSTQFESMPTDEPKSADQETERPAEPLADPD
jgi:hypothetical protein